MSRLRRYTPIVGLFASLPVFAHAHPGHEGHELTWDFQGGLVHPFTGWDHVIAMIAVGLWAFQLGGRARWAVPSAFVIAMAGGSALSHFGISLPGVEQGIGASVLILGLLIAAMVRLPTIVSGGLVSAFAIFHGYAHGSEMAPQANGFSYALGFVVATTALLTLGLGIGTLCEKSHPILSRYLGWAIAASGLVLLSQ